MDDELRNSAEIRLAAVLFARGKKEEQAIKMINLKCYSDIKQLLRKTMVNGTDYAVNQLKFEMWFAAHLMLAGSSSFDPVSFFTGGRSKGRDLQTA